MDTSIDTFGYACGTCIHFKKLMRYRKGECLKVRYVDQINGDDWIFQVDSDTYCTPQCEEFRHRIIQDEDKNFGKDYPLPFGKYKGTPVYELLTKDVNYCKWLFKTTQNAIIWTILKHYSEELDIDLEN